MPHSIPKDEKTTRNYVPFWSADKLANTKEIPTYLFRLTAPATDGTTNETNVCPPAPRNKNFLDLSSCDAANYLYQHLKPVNGHQDSCNFMSWSSSLSFLIQYAFYRSRTWWTDRNFKDIKLLVIDTRKLPKGIFAKDMDLLEFLSSTCECKYHEDLKYFTRLRKSNYYFGEYLTQGTLNLLDGYCKQVNFGEMVGLGLFDLLPDVLKDEQNWENWAKPVKSSRIPFFSSNHDETTLEDEVDVAMSIAKTLFRGPWSLPVAAMLLGLKPRQRNDPIIINGFIDNYGGGYPLTNSN